MAVMVNLQWDCKYVAVGLQICCRWIANLLLIDGVKFAGGLQICHGCAGCGTVLTLFFYTKAIYLDIIYWLLGEVGDGLFFPAWLLLKK
ncbi:hypothetical protein [Treponema sp. R8-4-B8]